MYLRSFAHREELFSIAERWFCARPEPTDALRLTEILICDGFIIGETLGELFKLLLETIYHRPYTEQRIHSKGELRDIICRSSQGLTSRVEELCQLYRMNPDFYYRETPINGVMCLDEEGCLLGLYRVKRARRIAEKANRKIANWIFWTVRQTAQSMAQERARRYGVPLEHLYTPEKEMVREFIEAEETIARSFHEGTIKFDRAALTINDVGGIKIIAEPERLTRLETILQGDPTFRVVDKENFKAHYRATNILLEVAWDAELICKRFKERAYWERYVGRGIPEERLRKGLESFLGNAKPAITIELILSNFPDMVESEFGSSIHEERIVAQRDNRLYWGYIPTNVELLVEYLFAVGFSPQIHTTSVPFKLWGRYLPDTLSAYIRRLYNYPEYDLLY